MRSYVVNHCLSHWDMLSDDEPGTTYYCTDVGDGWVTFRLRVPALNIS